MAAIKLGPTVLDISGVRAGDSNQITFTLTRDQAPLDITDYTIAAEVRKQATDQEVVITAVCQPIDPPNGKFYVAFSGDDVRTALGGQASFKGVWDLQIAAPGATGTLTIAAGSFEAVMDVTRV